MRFDPLSFLLGFGSASGLSFALWRYRERIIRLRESAEAQVEGTRRFIGRTAGARYANDVVRMAQSYHIAGDLFPLSSVLLEPSLLLGPEPEEPPSTEEGLARNVFDVIPMCHDLPYSYAAFNVETISLDQLGAGDPHVAILGIRGLGKSTTLAILALMALGEVKLETIEEIVQQTIPAKEREEIQRRAMERLYQESEDEEASFLNELGRRPAAQARPIPGLLPVLVHLKDVDFAMAADAKGHVLDPAEPLVRAAQRRVSAVTAQVVGSVVYPALEQGRALILIDGYDEISLAAREAYYYWLQQLLAVYGRNMVVIAGPASGYEPLVELGFTPTFLRAWRGQEYGLLARKWAAAWATQGRGRRRVAPPSEQVVRRISIDNQNRPMLDVTLKIWTALADDAQDTGRVGWYDALVNRRLSTPERRDLLPLLAVQVLETGRPVPRAILQETVVGWFPEPAEGEKAPKTEGILESFVKDGLLLHHPGDTFSFPHPHIASYLASEVLVQAGTDQATEVALEPAWQDALAFAAARINVLPAVYRKLSAAPNLLYSDLFEVVTWMPDTPADAPWRGDVFKRLAAALMAPEQYNVIREWALAAIIASRDKNVLFILRQALRAADPDVRRLACIGMGALGNPEVANDLAPMLVDDDLDVQLAAGMALGALGTEHALETMLAGLVEGADELRQAVAETLAGLPEEGHPVLRDGIASDDIMIRRACVYGLSRVKASWALTALYQAMLEDEQWFVRTAAEEAFITIQSLEKPGPRAHPEADSLTWMIEWAAERGEGVPAGANARQILIRVLQEGHPMHQAMAAQTLANLGHVPALKPLYAALRDREPRVRESAYEALARLQTRLGESLPGLI
ncbi:MAG: HEAT repeat domain-containing protein [Chloroflexi bacterium]|nr:HEAT repeat domain-containing protein [Chloroflexota bacterium]